MGGIKLKVKKSKGTKKIKEIDPDEIFEEEDIGKGDEFGACKPWLGAIKAPSDYEPGKDLGEEPNKKPKLEYVNFHKINKKKYFLFLPISFFKDEN